MPWYWVSHLGSVPCASYPYRWACASVSWEARKWLTEVLVERRSLRSPLMRLLLFTTVMTHPSGCQSVRLFNRASGKARLDLAKILPGSFRAKLGQIGLLFVGDEKSAARFGAGQSAGKIWPGCSSYAIRNARLDLAKFSWAASGQNVAKSGCSSQATRKVRLDLAKFFQATFGQYLAKSVCSSYAMRKVRLDLAKFCRAASGQNLAKSRLSGGPKLFKLFVFFLPLPPQEAHTGSIRNLALFL